MKDSDRKNDRGIGREKSEGVATKCLSRVLASPTEHSGELIKVIKVQSK